MSKKNETKTRTGLGRIITGSILTLVGLGSGATSWISNVINSSQPGGATGGVLPPFIVVPAAALFAIGGGLLTGFGIAKHRKYAKINAQEKVEVKEKVKSYEEVEQMREEQVKQVVRQNVPVKQKMQKVTLDDFITPSESVNSFVIYEADGKTIKHIDNQELRYKITSDENYKRYLQEYLRNYILSSNSGDCVIEVFGPDAIKDNSGKLVGKSFNFVGKDYKSQYGALVNYIEGLSQNLRNAEYVFNA